MRRWLLVCSSPGIAGWDVLAGSGRGRRGEGSPRGRGQAGSPARPGRERVRALAPAPPGPPREAEAAPSPAGPGPALGRLGRLPRALPRSRSPIFASPPAPRPRPRQAAGSAGDESRSLVPPLAAVAVKLERRPANKAPPPRPPSPLPEALHFTQVPTGEFAHLLLLFA